MQQLIEELDKLNVLEEGLLKNEKGRSLSLFGKDLDKIEEYYGNVYSTLYKGSFAQVAQAQRHRTIDYQIEMLDKINQLGIGPGGLGGTTTALKVNINTYPTHIAGLPVAVNICCHVNRHVVREI